MQLILSSGKHIITVSCSFWKAVLNEKIYIFRQNKKNVHILYTSGSASFFLLERQWVFELFVIVGYESLSCPQCEKMDLNIIQSLLKKVQICKRGWKTKECVHGPEGSFWRTAGNLIIQDKQGEKKQLWIIQVTTQYHTYVNFWTGSF